MYASNPNPSTNPTRDLVGIFPQAQMTPFEMFQSMTGAFAIWGQWAQQNTVAAATVRNEWYGFLQHRLQQDMAYASKLLTCRTPEEYWSTQANFWQQAAQDYQKEMSELTRICSAAVSEGTDAMQDATRKSARDRWCASDKVH